MLSKSISCLFIFFIYSSILLSQQVDNDFVSGKWEIEEVIVPEGKFQDKKEKKLLKELGKIILYFRWDGNFSFIYKGGNKEVLRNIKEFENSKWRTIQVENIISIEKETPIIVMPVEIGENIVFSFFEPIKFRVTKIEDELVSFSPPQEITIEEEVVAQQKIDSVFKEVTVPKRSFEDSVVTEYPVLEGCEESEGSGCLNKVIQNRIVDELNLSKYSTLLDLQRIKVFVFFAIDVDGVVKNIKAKSPDEELTYDLKLIINNMQVVTPAKNADGQPMLSTYAIPLTLMVQ
ncbi:hypothetical protein [uncultured Aquimarina sp.]|uniref:hypothetical protein n=1 Tax=uncultured Aquimarina sp. TaxID=575652 RepID=UPI002606B1DF|nr:hypothetical protein [uncultured Aquimarina sp.]